MKKIIIFLSGFTFLFSSLTQIQSNYELAKSSAENKKWKNVISFSKKIFKDAPKSRYAKELFYFTAVAFFHLNELEKSNDYFSKYLKKSEMSKYWEDALLYQFAIGKKYAKGAKKPIFGLKIMPKIIPCKMEAIKIFSNITSALAHKKEAIEALYLKGSVEKDLKDYEKAIDSFQTVIEKFPKSEFAIKSYIKIGKIYLKKIAVDNQDSRILSLSEINLQKFKEAFPKEKKITELEKDLKKIKEVYANGFYKMAKYFEKTKKLDASKIYYKKIISDFPNTKIAKDARYRLGRIEKK